MAAIGEQRTQEESAARRFWQSKMQAHPNIAGALAIGQEIAGFFLNGHFIVALARWVIRVSGYVAESALLFAVLWISATSVAPGLVELFMSEQLMQRLIWLALVTLALIPEIILGNAIINAASHWLSVVRDRRNAMAWVWAGAFTIPTLLFLLLTALTLNTLASAGGTFVQASAGLVGWRCFAGWSYGLLQLVYVGIGRRTLNQAQPLIAPAQSVAPAPAAAPIDYSEIARQLLPLVAQEVRQAVPDTTDVGEQLRQLRVHVEDVTTFLLTQSATTSETGQSTCVNSVEDRSFHAWETDEEPNVDRQEQQPVSAMSTPPRAKITRKLSTPASTKRATPRDRETARTKALRILKKHPGIGPTELAQKAHITRQYASKILANP